MIPFARRLFKNVLETRTKCVSDDNWQNAKTLASTGTIPAPLLQSEDTTTPSLPQLAALLVAALIMQRSAHRSISAGYMQSTTQTFTGQYSPRRPI